MKDLTVIGVGALRQYDQDIGRSIINGKWSMVPYARANNNHRAFGYPKDGNLVCGNTTFGRSCRCNMNEDIIINGQYPFGGVGMMLCYIDNHFSFLNAAS